MCVCVRERDRLRGASGKASHTDLCVCAREIESGVLVVRSDIGICVCV